VPQHTTLPLARAAGEATAGASSSRSHPQGGLHAARPGSPSVATRDRAAPLTSRATCLSSSQHDAAASPRPLRFRSRWIKEEDEVFTEFPLVRKFQSLIILTLI